MAGASYIQSIWDQHLLIVECNRQFINSDILEKIYLAEINSKNRYRNMLTAVKQIVTGTSLDRDPEALVRRVKTKKGGREAVYVAAKIMKLIIVCGLRDHTWNQVRKDFVSLFFSRELIPDVDPYNVSFPNNVPINASVPNNVPINGSVPNNVHIIAYVPNNVPINGSVPNNVHINASVPNNVTFKASVPNVVPFNAPATSNSCTVCLHSMPVSSGTSGRSIKRTNLIKSRAKLSLRKNAQDVCKAGEKLNLKSFWRQVIWCIRYKGISIRGLTEAAHREAEQRKRRNGASKKQKNIIGGLIAGLFKDRGNCSDFRDALAIHTKTGNVNDVINLIRSRLSVPGLGFNLVPSIRTVVTSNAKFTQHFIKLCNPERTFSGFRVDVVRCVKLAAYAILQTTNISGLKVDIWGDGAAIGGTEVTRLAFRLICEEISVQSSDSVFCFAAYRGKDSRFALEQNVGYEKVGDQTSGWLFKQTVALRELGVKLTFSGDNPFLLR